MSDMSRWQVACALALAALAAGPVSGAPSALPSELVSAAREYRASLANLLPFREEAVTHARATLATRRQLAEDGLIARREAETAEQTLATAEAALAATHAEIAQAERMEAEAAATVVLASLPPAKPGALLVTPTLLRFHGLRDWTLAQVTSVERFFADLSDFDDDTRPSTPTVIGSLSGTAAACSTGASLCIVSVTGSAPASWAYFELRRR